MSKERMPLGAKIGAGLMPIFAVFSNGCDSTNAETNTLPSDESGHTLQLNQDSADDRFASLFESDEARLAIALTGTYGAIGLYQSRKLSKKYDNRSVGILRASVPTALMATAIACGAENVETIDRHIPAGLFLAFTLLNASHSLISTLQSERSPEVRSSAMVSAGIFASIGTTLFIAAHNA